MSISGFSQLFINNGLRGLHTDPIKPNLFPKIEKPPETPITKKFFTWQNYKAEVKGQLKIALPALVLYGLAATYFSRDEEKKPD